jgi:hypothetical protein
MTTYREDIYPAHLETCKGSIIVFTMFVGGRDMPALIFTWWDLNGRIAAMSHQSLQ